MPHISHDLELVEMSLLRVDQLLDVLLSLHLVWLQTLPNLGSEVRDVCMQPPHTEDSTG